MEFHDVGRHCAVPECKQLDFLPFRCDLCREVFCADHRKYEHHHCARIEDRKDATVPVCPLCSQVVPLKRGEDVNARIDRHISRGCPKESTSVAGGLQQCHFPKCHRKELMLLDCSHCGESFCVTHRRPDSHRCAAGLAAETCRAQARAAEGGLGGSRVFLEAFSDRAAASSAATSGSGSGRGAGSAAGGVAAPGSGGRPGRSNVSGLSRLLRQQA